MTAQSKGRLFSILYVVALFGLFFVFQSVGGNTAVDVSYNDFVGEVRAGHIDEAQVGALKYVGKFKPGVKKPNEPQAISTGRLPGVDDRALIDDMQKHNVR